MTEFAMHLENLYQAVNEFLVLLLYKTTDCLVPCQTLNVGLKRHKGYIGKDDTIFKTLSWVTNSDIYLV